jgi:DNA invertase Pin-like site-specific DNA recombinase
MAAVAQDEVRKLSERLKFGFRQSIKNGRVLGNKSLWGYDKKECRLTVNEAEAETVRLVFKLYAEEGLGLRRTAHKLYELGFLSRNGGEISSLTIKNIITNPKYKGWYCGNKSRSVKLPQQKVCFTG